MATRPNTPKLWAYDLWPQTKLVDISTLSLEPGQMHQTGQVRVLDGFHFVLGRKASGRLSMALANANDIREQVADVTKL